MKSKEEILNEKAHGSGLINFRNALKHIWLRQWDVVSAESVIKSAMDEYAQQQAVAFAEWINKNYGLASLPSSEFVEYWSYNEMGNKKYSTADLYAKFIEEQGGK